MAEFDIGDEVIAQWIEDEQWYEAKILEVFEDDGQEIFVVVFTEYGNEAECTADMLRLPDGVQEEEEEEEEEEEPMPPAAAAAPEAGFVSARRQAAARKKKKGPLKKVATDYDADESVIHGIENIDDIVEQAEFELFGKLDAYEQSASSAKEYAMWAATLTELAVLPVTPEDDVEQYWTEAFQLADQAVEMDASATVLTQSAHLDLRRGLYLSTNDQEGADDSFARAVESYRSVFDLAPVRVVLKFIVNAISHAATLDLHHFLGVFDNGYSGALLRSNEEVNATLLVQSHTDALAQMQSAGVAHPLLRAHVFGVIKMVVLGFSVAVADDLPEDQAWLLLALWDSLTRIEMVDEALLVGCYVLKLNEVVGDMETLIDAIDGISDYAVQVNYDRLIDTVEDATDDEIDEMARAELDEMLASLDDYEPDEVLQALRDMQAELVRMEQKRPGKVPNLRLKDVDLNDLFELAHSRYAILQFCAARTFLALLSVSKSAAKVVTTLCAQCEGPQALALLLISNNAEVAVAASHATLLFLRQVPNVDDMETSGIVEACIYLVSHNSVNAAHYAIQCLLLLAEAPACVDTMIRLKKQLGTALLDQVFCTNANMVRDVCQLLIKVFELSSKKDVQAVTLELIPEVCQEDLREVIDIVSEELQGARKSGAAKGKSPVGKKPLPAPGSKKKPLPAKQKAPQSNQRGRGYTQKLEAQYSGKTMVMSPISDDEPTSESEELMTPTSSGFGLDIDLDPQAQEELERELANMDEVDTAALSEISQIETECMEQEGEDARVITLLKMGAACEEQVNDCLDEGAIDEAEDFIDQAVAKYQALLLLSPHSHIGLRRIADALLRKAEFREGPEADALYGQAIEFYEKDITWHEEDGDSHVHKVQAMIDRAKNKAAEEEASKKGTFNVTRKHLAEAKQASQHLPPDIRQDFINSINEVLTYCRLQSDMRKEADGRGKQKAASSKKASNPDAMVRKGSMMVAPPKKKATQGKVVGEMERLQSVLASKKPISKVGKLCKEGGGTSLLGRKTWKSRLFELNESSLEYYEKDNKTEKPKGVISLHEVTTARSCNVQGKSHTFEVVTESRKFQIQASSESEKEEWIKSILWNVDRQKLQRKLLSKR